MEHGKAGWWALARALGARKVIAHRYGIEPIVLMYHRFSREPSQGRVSLEQLEAQLRFLVENTQVISLQELSRGLREGRQWSRPATVITIDDGHYDLYEVAFPLLRQYGLPATVFVTTGFIDGCMWYWPDKLRYLLAQHRPNRASVVLEGRERVFDLQTDEQCEYAWNELADHVFQLAPAAAEAFLADLAARLRVILPVPAPTEFRSVSWDQIREISGQGIEIGAHGVNHERLTAISDEAARFEIVESKRVLESRIQIDVRSFAYPFGGVEDQNAFVRGIVRGAGFDAGCVSFSDTNLYSDPYALRRFGVGPCYWDFVKAADGLKYANSLRMAAKAKAV